MGTLVFGTATRKITPSYPVWMYGYADRDHRSDGVNEPLVLGCLAIGDGSQTVLIVTCDLVGIQSHVCEGLYALLERETGIGYPNVLLACSHTHFAPGLHANAFPRPDTGLVEPDPRFVAAFEVKLIEAARGSLRELRPGRLETTRLRAPQVLFNRRTVRADGSVETNFLYPREPGSYTFSPTDTELSVLRVRDELGVRAVLANFGCHPVTGGVSREQEHYRVSSDYVHYLRRTLADQYACPVFFTLGAAGDAVPVNRHGDCRQRIGSVLGNTIILAERTYVEEEGVGLAADSLSLEVETIVKTDPRAAEAEYERAREAFALLLDNPGIDRESETYRASAQAFQQKSLAVVRSRLYPENRYTVKVQFLRIGRTVLVALPFEVLSEISLRMKERFPSSVLVSCAGGYQGYLPLAYEYERGGYEASEQSTHFVPGTADRLLEAILAKLQEW